MAARLHALSDNEVASSRLCGPALASRASLPRNQSASAVPCRDKALVRIAFEELDDPYRSGRFGNDLDWRQIRDQEADP